MIPNVRSAGKMVIRRGVHVGERSATVEVGVPLYRIKAQNPKLLFT